MSKNDCLNLKHNLNIAQIFLNTFGLVLGDTKEADAFSQIKIFDQDRNEVGELSLTNDKVIISANYHKNVLNASFDIAKLSSFIDFECESAPAAMFGKWSSKVVFQVQKSNNINLSGELLMTCSADTELGISCLCHPLVNCEVPGKGQIILKILRDGSTFNLEIIAKENYEVIDIRPWDWLNGFILHDKKSGKYDEEKFAYPYRRYAGVFNGAESGENKNKLHVFLSEEEYENQLTFRSEFPPKVGDDNSRETLLQKGRLMQDLDPNMYEKIQKLRDILLIGDISLLDNLFSVCYDSYTDEELNSLLGVNRQKLNYQNGADNLVDACFEIGTKESLSSEIITRLLKK